MVPGMIHEAHALNRVQLASLIAAHLLARGWTAERLREADFSKRRAAMAIQEVSKEMWAWAAVVMEAMETVGVKV